MKFSFTLCAISILYSSIGAFAQKLDHETIEHTVFPEINSEKTISTNYQSGGNRAVLWSEDFSNGFAGQGDNGAWTFDGPQGNLWFITYPAGFPGAYSTSTAVANPNYNNQLPNYYNSAAMVLNSATRENGLAMLDMDRWNSTSVVNAPGSPTFNVGTSYLISPIIDLSGASNGLQLKFSQKVRLCCTNLTISVSVSSDGGQSYGEPQDLFTRFGIINQQLESIDVSVCLTPLLANAQDLSQVRVRFNWDGEQSHYYWMLDDIKIEDAPENDLDLGIQTYLNDYKRKFSDPAASYVDYYNSFAYDNTPTYLVKPLSFGAVVVNRCSQNTQNNIRLKATVTAPNGVVQEILSDENALNLASFMRDTVYTEPTLLDVFASAPVPTGLYTVAYEVIQDQEDENPQNSIGQQKTFTVSSDAANNDFAIMQNGGRAYGGTFAAAAYTSDALINTPYTFPDPAIANSVITHVEVVFLSEGNNETMPEQIVYFNVRLGSVGDEDPDDESTLTTVVFQANDPLGYDSQELEYEIQAEDIWTQPTNMAQIWTSFELPSPVLIEPNKVYSPELHLPIASGPVAYIPVDNSFQELRAVWIRDLAASATWVTGSNAVVPSMRFRTQSILGMDEISYESGIKLVQNFPNPFINQTTIQYQLDETAKAWIEVFDITGKLVFQDNLGQIGALAANSYLLNSNGLEPGIYTYSIVTATDRVSRKMTIE